MTLEMPTPDCEPGEVLADGVFIDSGALSYVFSRSGGPGGQAVNKLATKATLRLRLEDIRGLPPAAMERLRRLAARWLTDADELVISAETSRSQLDNKRECLERLRVAVGEAQRVPKPRKRTRPSRAAVQRRLEAKRQRGEAKRRRQRPDDK